MKIQLELRLSKRDMDYLVEAAFKEMMKQSISEHDRRSMAAFKAWETRRKNDNQD